VLRARGEIRAESWEFPTTYARAIREEMHPSVEIREARPQLKILMRKTCIVERWICSFRFLSTHKFLPTTNIFCLAGELFWFCGDDSVSIYGFGWRNVIYIVVYKYVNPNDRVFFQILSKFRVGAMQFTKIRPELIIFIKFKTLCSPVLIIQILSFKSCNSKLQWWLYILRLHCAWFCPPNVVIFTIKSLFCMKKICIM
jgi:hypothetical protein